MVKMVLKDLYARRWEALKSNLFHAVMCMLYLLVVFNPYAVEMESVKRMVSVTQFFMLFLMLLFQSMYPNNLGTTMFLVPIEREDKRKYLYTAFGVKVAAITLIHGICNGMLVAFGKMLWWQAILLVLCLSLWSLVAGISNFKFGDSIPPTGEQTMKGSDYRALLAYIISVFLFLALAFWEGIEKDWEITLIILLVILQILVCAWTLKKDFHSCIEQGITYEVVKKRSQKQRGKRRG